MNDGEPGIGVTFTIEPNYAGLGQAENAMDQAAVRMVRDADLIEKATGGMFRHLGNGRLELAATGAAAQREMRKIAAEKAAVEKSGEAMVRQLQREAEVAGMTRAEIRAYRAEKIAAAAEAKGNTDLANRLRAAAVEMERLDAATSRLGATGVRSRGSMTQLSFQINDVATMAALGAPPMQIFASQAGQIFQVAQMAEGGVKGFGREVGMLALRFAPLIAVAAVATAGLGLLVRWVNQGVTNNQLTRDLGDITGGANATKQELYKLREETIGWGDVTKAVFQEVGSDVASQFVSDMEAMGEDVKSVLDNLTSYGKAALAGLYAGVAGTRSYLNEIQEGGITGLVATFSDPTLLERTYGAAFDQADTYLTGLGERIRARSLKNARERLAEKIGFNTAPKGDGFAERLAREAAAVEAQINGLYELADAYGVSGAAALIAEARAKAETAAIKGRADVEAVVARTIRLAVAQRVADAAKTTAAMREQTMVQLAINEAVAAGTYPAELAGDLMRDRIADLPLLAALEAARATGDVRGAEAAAKALDDQRAARDSLTDAERRAQVLAANDQANRQIEMLREELRLVGATEAARVRALAVLRASQEAEARGWVGDEAAQYINSQVEIAGLNTQLQLTTDAYNASLTHQIDLWSELVRNVENAAQGMAEAFGEPGRALGDMTRQLAAFSLEQRRQDNWRREQLKEIAGIEDAATRTSRERQVQELYSARTMTARIGLYGDMAAAARGFFDRESAGYEALTGAMKVFRAIEFALSVKSIAQNAIETGADIANSVARTAVKAKEAVVSAISSLPFPLNIAAGAATIAALASLGVSLVGSFGGSGQRPEAANRGTGTVLGDGEAQSASIKRAIDSLREVDTLMLGTSREMLASLRSIENQIGGVASLVVRAGNVNASAGVQEGFRSDATGNLLKGIVTGGGLFSKVPIIGGIVSGIGNLLGSLFGAKTEVVGGGLYGRAQTLGSVLNNGFDADYYSDVKKTSRFLGIKTGTSYSTRYSAADAGLEGQFTLILREFSSAIAAAAGPLGLATDDVRQRLNGFVVDIGKIDLQGKTGEQIQEELTAVFGAAADRMASAAFPGFERFQKVGEGLFETVVRVASTVEAITGSLDLLGGAARTLGIDAKVGLAGQFDSIGDFTSAAQGYFERFYSAQEQATARAAQFDRVFASLGTTTPSTLAAFRALVEAQDLTTTAGQQTYATLLQLAPAFADLKSSMEGAKSAADIAAERADLERKLLELQGNTAALRALDLAKIDESNRTLQQQIWAIEDAQEAARAADELRKAWTSVGDSIEDEIRRIRGLSDATGGGSFAALMGQFNAQTALARGGDQEAAKALPGLSQALLKAAADAATSRQELNRVQAETAASLEATLAYVARFGSAPTPVQAAQSFMNAADVAPGGPINQRTANDNMASELAKVREELAAMRRESASGLAIVGINTGKAARVLEDVSDEHEGRALSIGSAA